MNLEGRLKEMTQFVDDLDVRLNDVLTSASHLQTVWERVEVYITSSIEELGKITDGQRLAIFLIFSNDSSGSGRKSSALRCN